MNDNKKKEESFWIKTVSINPDKCSVGIRYEQVANLEQVRKIIQKDNKIFGYQLRSTLDEFDQTSTTNITHFTFVVDGELPKNPYIFICKATPIKDGDIFIDRKTMNILGYYKGEEFISFLFPVPERRTSFFLGRNNVAGKPTP